MERRDDSRTRRRTASEAELGNDSDSAAAAAPEDGAGRKRRKAALASERNTRNLVGSMLGKKGRSGSAAASTTSGGGRSKKQASVAAEATVATTTMAAAGDKQPEEESTSKAVASDNTSGKSPAHEDAREMAARVVASLAGRDATKSPVAASGPGDADHFSENSTIGGRSVGEHSAPGPTLMVNRFRPIQMDIPNFLTRNPSHDHGDRDHGHDEAVGEEDEQLLNDASLDQREHGSVASSSLSPPLEEDGSLVCDNVSEASEERQSGPVQPDNHHTAREQSGELVDHQQRYHVGNTPHFADLRFTPYGNNSHNLPDRRSVGSQHGNVVTTRSYSPWTDDRNSYYATPQYAAQPYRDPLAYGYDARTQQTRPADRPPQSSNTDNTPVLIESDDSEDDHDNGNSNGGKNGNTHAHIAPDALIHANNAMANCLTPPTHLEGVKNGLAEDTDVARFKLLGLPDKWLSGDIVYAIVKIVAAMRPLSVYVTASFEGNVSACGRLFLDIINQPRMDTLLGVLNISESHWVLVVFDIYHGWLSESVVRVDVFDSLPSSPLDSSSSQKLVARAQAKLAPFIESLRQGMIQRRGQKVHDHPIDVEICLQAGPKQDNANDCGVAVAVAALYRCVGKSLPTKTLFPVWRSFFLHMMTQGKASGGFEVDLDGQPIEVDEDELGHTLFNSTRREIVQLRREPVRDIVAYPKPPLYSLELVAQGTEGTTSEALGVVFALERYIRGLRRECARIGDSRGQFLDTAETLKDIQRTGRFLQRRGVEEIRALEGRRATLWETYGDAAHQEIVRLDRFRAAADEAARKWQMGLETVSDDIWWVTEVLNG